MAKRMCINCGKVTDGLLISYGEKKMFKCSVCKNESENIEEKKPSTHGVIFKGSGWGGRGRE